ncbi:MAG: NeuD/PglB/VioB family sugar acetyltransferase [Anaerolineales bacterium]
MSAATPIIIPLLNPNETEARLVTLHVKEGQKLKKGQLVAVLETTKSSFELESEGAGYLLGLTAKQGETLRAGETLAFLAESKDWKPPKVQTNKNHTDGLPEGLRITQPALTLAQNKNLDLTTLPIGPIVTEEQVRKALSHSAKPDAIKIPEEARNPHAIIVYGGGGHGKSVIDLLRAVGGFTVIGLVDDGREPGDQTLGIPVLGGSGTLAPILDAGCILAVNAVGGIGAMSSRILVFERLRSAGFDFPSLVHPSAVVEPNATLNKGVQVFPLGYLGSESKIGFGCIVNTGAIVSHDCVLEDYVNLAPGSILAGAVHIGEGSLIGMGVTINLDVKIGAGARVGNGATVKADVPAGGIVRAGAIWPN